MFQSDKFRVWILPLPINSSSNSLCVIKMQIKQGGFTTISPSSVTSSIPSICRRTSDISQPSNDRSWSFWMCGGYLAQKLSLFSYSDFVSCPFEAVALDLVDKRRNSQKMHWPTIGCHRVECRRKRAFKKTATILIPRRLLEIYYVC